MAGKFFILLGIIFIVLGLVLLFWGPKISGWKLPGDIVCRRGNFTIYFPLTTCLLLSLILTLILRFIFKAK